MTTATLAYGIDLGPKTVEVAVGVREMLKEHPALELFHYGGCGHNASSRFAIVVKHSRVDTYDFQAQLGPRIIQLLSWRDALVKVQDLGWIVEPQWLLLATKV